MMRVMLFFFIGLLSVKAQTEEINKQEYVYYFPEKIREGLAKEIYKWKNTEVFLVIREISIDESISFSLVPFYKSEIDTICYGFLKIKDSGRITYIDGKKYYVVYGLDQKYGTLYAPFMSLTERKKKVCEKQMLRKGQEEKIAQELYPTNFIQIYEHARYISFDAEGNIIENK